MESSVRREILLKADPARVFEAFTDVGDLLSWYADGLGPGWERSLSDPRSWLEEGRKPPGS